MDFSQVDTIYDPLEKRRIKRWILLLPGAGCSWYKQCGGCTMCGFNTSTYEFNFGGRLLPNFVFTILLYIGYWAIRLKGHKPEALYIYNGGSFFNDKEIPFKTQKRIAKFVGRKKFIKKILVESRCEYITQEKLFEFNEYLKDKQLELAIGLESADDKIRNIVIKKGLKKSDFEQTVYLCKRQDVQIFVYVFLKPLTLTNEQAVKDTVETIRYCFSLGGCSEVSISCAFIQENTKMAKIFKTGEYTPPRLWDIIEVVKKTHELGPVRIGALDDEPPPIALPSNCPRCNDKVKAAIEHYRETNDISVFEKLNCECKNSPN